MRTLALVSLGALLIGCGGSTNMPAGHDTGGDTGEAGEGGNGESGSGGSGGKAGSGGAGTGGSSAGSGGSASGGSGGDAGVGGASDPDAGAADSGVVNGDSSVSSVDPTGAAPYGCTGCKRLFDGKTLDGWNTAPGAWMVKEGGVLASTGKQADIYTKDDIGDARIFFQVRQVMGNHKPCTVMFGKRPADPTAPARGLGGAQFQPPNGAFWNYGVGGTFNRLTNPMFDVAMWHQCEVIIKEAGSFRAACCPVGASPCKGVEVLQWKGPGKKAPFDIMMHNGGLFDEYREIWIEPNPTDDGFLSQK